MKALFVMRHSGYVRNFEWVLRVLAGRGHRVHLAFEQERPHGDLAARLADEHPGAITVGVAPLRHDVWQPLVWKLGRSADYLRYHGRPFKFAGFLRRRAARDVPKAVLRLAPLPVIGGDRGVLARMLRAWEEAIPIQPALSAFVDEGGFDIVMVTPLVSEPSQHDLARAARAIGRPVVLAVHSWDNLTNKGLVRVVPDRTYVWNETQRGEASALHGIPAERVAVVGAHSYDHWFDWQASTTREAFCARAGLDPARPYLLYLGSSRPIAGDERPIVVRWLEAVRADPELRDLGVLIRPHPTSGRDWADNPLASTSNAVVWPPTGADPRDDARKADYFDSIFHAAAAVGLNTSALIEAAIVGRRTYTMQLLDSQSGTLHFQYLLRENGGPLTVAESLPEHVSQLRQALGDPAEDDWSRAFVRRFIRPNGLELPGAEAFVDDLERFAVEPAALPPRRPSRVVAKLTLPIARAVYGRRYGDPRTARRSSRRRRAPALLAGLGRRARARRGAVD